MEMSIIINQMAILFIALVVGYFGNKLKVLPAESDRVLSGLVVKIAMPCTILNSVFNCELRVTGSETIHLSLMIILTLFLGLLLSIPAALLLSKNKSDRGIYSFIIAFGNVGSMGFAVVPSILGDDSSFFVALYNLPFTLIAFSVGILMLAGKKGKINLKIIFNPPLVAAIIAIALFYMGIRPPEIVTGTVRLIGGITTPTAMIIIGSTLAALPLRSVFTEWRLYIATFVKLIAIPIITWLILRNLITNHLMLSTLVVLSGMPTANAATMLTLQYGGNEQLAAKGIFLTTLLSVATVPLLIYLFLR